MIKEYMKSNTKKDFAIINNKSLDLRKMSPSQKEREYIRKEENMTLLTHILERNMFAHAKKNMKMQQTRLRQPTVLTV